MAVWPLLMQVIPDSTQIPHVLWILFTPLGSRVVHRLALIESAQTKVCLRLPKANVFFFSTVDGFANVTGTDAQEPNNTFY